MIPTYLTFNDAKSNQDELRQIAVNLQASKYRKDSIERKSGSNRFRGRNVYYIVSGQRENYRYPLTFSQAITALKKGLRMGERDARKCLRQKTKLPLFPMETTDVADRILSPRSRDRSPSSTPPLSPSPPVSPRISGHRQKTRPTSYSADAANYPEELISPADKLAPLEVLKKQCPITFKCVDDLFHQGFHITKISSEGEPYYGMRKVVTFETKGGQTKIEMPVEDKLLEILHLIMQFCSFR